MRLEFDPDKRDKTLAEQGLDFARAEEIFAGVKVTIEETRRIISMRKANEREIAKYSPTLG